MTLRLLRTFDANQLFFLDAALRDRTVQRAGRSRHLPRPPTCPALARLRRQRGDPLVVRQRGGLVPTTRAERLEPELRASLARLEAALAGGGFDPALAAATFTLAAADLAELVVLPPLLARLAEVAPAVQVRVANP